MHILRSYLLQFIEFNSDTMVCFFSIVSGPILKARYTTEYLLISQYCNFLMTLSTYGVVSKIGYICSQFNCESNGAMLHNKLTIKLTHA